jgi:hypothetical protein
MRALLTGYAGAFNRRYKTPFTPTAAGYSSEQPLTLIREKNRGISGFEQLRTPVAGILIVGL